MDWEHRADALAESLDVSDRWRRAFAATPRHVFTPRFFGNDRGKGWFAVDQQDEAFLNLVYRNEALITQLDGDSESWEKTRRDGVYYGGRATSSSSKPGLMAAMLDALNVESGMNVLEIGTGTGYNAALLCHQLGDDHVTTVDVDPNLMELARQRLAAIGYRPTLMTYNALHELPDGPYDRIITTVGPRMVPPAWLKVVRPDGLILVNPYSDLNTNAIFALTVHGDGTASGHAPIDGSFMPTRDNAMPFGFKLYDGTDGQKASAQLPGEILDDFGPFYLFVSLILRDVQLYQFQTSGELRPGLVGRDGSWAYEANGEVIYRGPRNLWAELEKAHALWQDCGRPDREQLGLTVARNQQSLWVDSPDQIVHVEVDAVSIEPL